MTISIGGARPCLSTNTLLPAEARSSLPSPRPRQVWGVPAARGLARWGRADDARATARSAPGASHPAAGGKARHPGARTGALPAPERRGSTIRRERRALASGATPRVARPVRHARAERSTRAAGCWRSRPGARRGGGQRAARSRTVPPAWARGSRAPPADGPVVTGREAVAGTGRRRPPGPLPAYGRTEGLGGGREAPGMTGRN
jgi:hypothetical protein